ncbi:SMAD/FHA domain-containing protein [Endogone sp. FLAS-F59071]|nr:SMAD/FHA domain-containing protein [Endogone sp. FLAS-F59071]|eukprot:RUS13865.1 SMAD/FHA domain-containing protein [Endogone sp. FLAS-F59071]
MSPTALWRVKSPRNRIAADGGKNACGSSHQERSPKIRRRTIDDNDAQTSACINNVLVRPWGRLNTINTEYKTAWLTDDITFFGRQQDCHGELTYVSSQPDHKKISAHHCAIIKKDDDAFIQDLGMNGTFLNGDRLPPRVLYMLKDGDEIVLSYADDQSDLRQKGACDRHGRLVHIGYIFQFTTRTI